MDLWSTGGAGVHACVRHGQRDSIEGIFMTKRKEYIGRTTWEGREEGMDVFE